MKEVKEARGYFGNVYEIFIDDKLTRKINIVRVNKIFNNFVSVKKVLSKVIGNC